MPATEADLVRPTSTGRSTNAVHVRTTVYESTAYSRAPAAVVPRPHRRPAAPAPCGTRSRSAWPRACRSGRTPRAHWSSTPRVDRRLCSSPPARPPARSPTTWTSSPRSSSRGSGPPPRRSATLHLGPGPRDAARGIGPNAVRLSSRRATVDAVARVYFSIRPSIAQNAARRRPARRHGWPHRHRAARGPPAPRERRPVADPVLRDPRRRPALVIASATLGVRGGVKWCGGFTACYRG
jgi:hypothetical protein